ncbi:uncharacterized protein KY384_008445 [Bacidia gigantensis]|uniref:uncharacterized protein n=1 Tax=Bacidia gigantensis TaxID=2732470 RepID=UPI001D05BF42|nr:uncharacterized protein KY384_008445 [Bacidia gigantensis]KAG8527016.1 hypothetical protein KY384_008445 [Bacidia gigantensis]
MAPISILSEEERRRKIVNINSETVTNTTSSYFPGHYPGEDHTWSLSKFKNSFRVRFHQNETDNASFSLIGIDASIANAFRRILIAEIPTLAIEYVYIEANDSVISDEVLAARLGQIPLTASRDGLRWLNYIPRPPQGMLGEDSGKPEDDREPKDNDTIVLKLHVKCEWKDGKKKGAEGTPEELYEHSNVYASDLVWEPQGRQEEMVTEKEGGGVRTTNPRILLAKIRPGDEIQMVCHAVKGIGADHAKFSPVATAAYRLMPTIDIVKPILGTDAKKFARCFPKGVIGFEQVTKEESQQKGSGYEGNAGEKKAVVKDSMRDTVSRECLRHEEFQKKVKLGRVRDHFIFSVESTGQIASDDLFIESVRILRGKCRALKGQLADIMR